MLRFILAIVCVVAWFPTLASAACDGGDCPGDLKLFYFSTSDPSFVPGGCIDPYSYASVFTTCNPQTHGIATIPRGKIFIPDSFTIVATSGLTDVNEDCTVEIGIGQAGDTTVTAQYSALGHFGAKAHVIDNKWPSIAGESVQVSLAGETPIAGSGFLVVILKEGTLVAAPSCTEASSVSIVVSGRLVGG